MAFPTKEKIMREAFFKQIGYNPHPSQQLYHNSTARFRLPNCGRRFGKTMMAACDLEPKLFRPNSRFWIVGPTYNLAEKEFRQIWKDLIVNLEFGKDPTIKKVYNRRQGDMRIEFTKWGTILEAQSAQNPDSLVGDSLDGVIMSEAAKHTKETWERYIRPALSDKRGFADFPTTPEGFDWLYDQWMLGKDPSLQGVYESWKFPSWYNQVIFPLGVDDPEIKLARKTLTETSFKQEYGAEFGSFAGKIYDEWDISKHVKNHEFRPDWPNYIAFDWGFTNPMAAVEFQVSPQDEIFIWREYYKPRMRLENALREMQNRLQPEGYHIDLCFGDAADPEAVATVNAKFAPCFADPKSKTNWRDGVDLIISFLARDAGDEDEYGTPADPYPALFVDPSCTNTIREFNNYKAPSGSNGKNAPEAGLKQDDHALDALRYGLVHIFRLGAIYSLGDTNTVTVQSPQAVQKPTPKPVEGVSHLSDVNGFRSNTVPTPAANISTGLIFEVADAAGFFSNIGEF